MGAGILIGASARRSRSLLVEFVCRFPCDNNGVIFFYKKLYHWLQNIQTKMNFIGIMYVMFGMIVYHRKSHCIGFQQRDAQFSVY